MHVGLSCIFVIATPEYLDITSIGDNALVVAASLRVGGLCFKLCPARCDIVDACVLTDRPNWSRGDFCPTFFARERQ